MTTSSFIAHPRQNDTICITQNYEMSILREPLHNNLEDNLNSSCSIIFEDDALVPVSDGKQSKNISNTIKNKKKRVSFAKDDELEKWTENPMKYLDMEDKGVRWWRKEELYRIKASARAKAVILRELGCRNDVGLYSLAMAHKKTKHITNFDSMQLIKLPPQLPNEDLLLWCSYNDGRRGLERLSSAIHSAWHKKGILYTRHAVLTEQYFQRTVTKQYDPESIANASKQISKHASVFALFMGEADAMEVYCNDPNYNNQDNNSHEDVYFEHLDAACSPAEDVDIIDVLVPEEQPKMNNDIYNAAGNDSNAQEPMEKHPPTVTISQ